MSLRILAALLFSLSPALYLYVFRQCFLTVTLNIFSVQDLISLPSISVIYSVGGLLSVPYFLDWEYRTPTFQDTGEEFAVNSVVIRGDVQILNYLKPFHTRARSRRSP